jgi:hypothetical protein
MNDILQLPDMNLNTLPIAFRARRRLLDGRAEDESGRPPVPIVDDEPHGTTVTVDVPVRSS